MPGRELESGRAMTTTSMTKRWEDTPDPNASTAAAWRVRSASRILARVNRVVDLDQLSANERLELVQDLWDQIAAEPEQVPVTAAQRHELDRRLAEHAASPDDVAEWAVVKARTSK